MDRRDFLRTAAMTAISMGLEATGLGSGSEVHARTNDTFDTILKNGIIYTGDGRTVIKGDVAFKDGKIAAIGKHLGKNAKKVIDVKGLAVSPGFIDLHSHTDSRLFRMPKGDSRIYQGVTTELGGNCGDRSGVGKYPRTRDFLDALQASGIGINYASLVGHGDLRNKVVGPYNTPATKEQIARMCKLLEEELERGASGLSYGLEYAPGCYCNTEEMVALNKVVAKYNALYTIHMRNEADRVLEAMDEAIIAARLSGARLEISHLKAQNPANFDKIDTMLGKIDSARMEGIDIAFDRYPYTAFSTGLTNLIPREMRAGHKADILARLNDPQTCASMREWCLYRMKEFGGAQQVCIAACSKPENAVFSGKNIAECCRISGLDEWEMVRHLLISENLSVNQITFAMKEENLEKIYAHPLSMPISDGSVESPEVTGSSMPHPRAYGTFPRFFEKYVREKHIVDMPTAIYKCTALPASRLRLKDRGMLIPGYAADVTVFNPDTIADIATYANPHQFPTGICHVFVNGIQAIENGTHTGNIAGQVIFLQ